jgi:hypothetical protein
MAMGFDVPTPTLGTQGVAMITITPFHPLGFSLTRLRLALHLPPPGSQASTTGSALSAPRVGWIDRLAAWSDRHPPTQHRLGSYTRRR